jgi:hypothetical protein
MDFKQETDFREADRRYADLERQREAGGISGEEFEAQRRQLMVLDDEGRWWSKFPDGGEWHYHDGSAWVRGTPPAYREAAPEAASAPVGNRTQAAAASSPARRKRSVWPWLLGIVIVLVGLAGIGLIVWSFLPGSLPSFLQGGSQGESAPEGGGSDEGGSSRDQSGSGGAAFDAVFVHRATAENITANSTYLDSETINDNPEAILYVTQSWNPDGGDGIYNDHPVGVWYDEGAGRWAIFNQDREAMPEGAAFNVAVLEGPAE